MKVEICNLGPVKKAESEAFLSQERVSVYLFDEGVTRNVLNEDGIIDWETFNAVFEDGMRLYSQLLTPEDLD